METAKRKRLEAAGWSVGSATDFLKLSPEDAAFVGLKLRLSKSLKRHQQSKKLSQAALAKKIKSSQSRVARMEAGDASVSIDLLIRALLAIGDTRQDIAKVLGSRL